MVLLRWPVGRAGRGRGGGAPPGRGLAKPLCFVGPDHRRLRRGGRRLYRRARRRLAGATLDRAGMTAKRNRVAASETIFTIRRMPRPAADTLPPGARR